MSSDPTREQLLNENEALRQRLAQAEEVLNAKDRFLAVLSHELRTPLSPVLSGVALLEIDDALSDRARTLLEVIRRNVELQARLIDDLLDLTRITRGKIDLNRQRIDLCTIVDRAVEACRPDILARRLHFGVDCGSGKYFVDADAARLQQVFWNLLKNAVKFTPHGGCVGIRCSSRNGHVAVEVSDSGIGIEPAALDAVFDSFGQAEKFLARQFTGLGLGLTISRALVELHGGTIDCRSDGPGTGATFRVLLPAVLLPSGAQETTAAARPRLGSPAGRKPLRVLLVEDHGDTVQILGAVLKLEGHEVETAGDVATAVTTALGGTFDVLISDLGLPDRSGLDLLRELRSRGWAVPAIALSGYGQERDIEQSRAAGFAAHIVKPADPHLLLEAMQRIVTQPK